MRVLTFFLLPLLSGCTVQVSLSTQAVNALGLAVLGTAVYQYEQTRVGTPDPVPELAADRTVHEQDCTRPVDHTQGNLRCK